MAIELKQQLRISQQLVMTPQLQQAIKLLQLNQIELVNMVEQELQENPCLEEDEREEPTTDEVNDETPGDENDSASVEDAGDFESTSAEEVDSPNSLNESSADADFAPDDALNPNADGSDGSEAADAGAGLDAYRPARRSDTGQLSIQWKHCRLCRRSHSSCGRERDDRQQHV